MYFPARSKAAATARAPEHRCQRRPACLARHLRHPAGRRRIALPLPLQASGCPPQRSTSPSASWLSTPSSGPPHILRHTCLNQARPCRQGLVLVADLAGHAYLPDQPPLGLPNAANRQAAMDTLTINY